jgi:uncharacterized protein (TIGR04222 family)
MSASLSVRTFGEAGQPWGLSGPSFLLLYVALLAVCAAALVLGRRSARRQRRPSYSGPLSIDELAYLGGGYERMAQVALVSLLDDGSVRVQSRGRLHLVGTPSPGTGARATVAEYLRDHPATTYSRGLVGTVAASAGARSVADGLQSRGLVLDDADRRVARQGVPLLAGLVGLGVLRWLEGVQAGRPVGGLTLLLVVAAALALWGWRRPPVRTRPGDAALKEQQAQVGDGLLAAGAAPGAAAVLAVACLGLAAWDDEELRRAAFPAAVYATGGDGGGGGGCGGGGCGGCGG